MNKFLIALTSHMNLIPGIVAAAQALQAIGHSQESTVQKIVQAVEVTAAVGETVPNPLVQSISTMVESIVTQVFPIAPAPPAAPAVATTIAPPAALVTPFTLPTSTTTA